jgi:hypothetical protein
MQMNQETVRQQGPRHPTVGWISQIASSSFAVPIAFVAILKKSTRKDIDLTDFWPQFYQFHAKLIVWLQRLR